MDTLRIYDVIDKVKTNSRQFVSNFYVLPNNFEDWGQRGWNWLSISHDFALWYRQESGCRRIYFAGELGSIDTAIKKINDSARDPFIVDLIGNMNAIEPLAGIFEQSHFKRYEKLMRLCASTEKLTLSLRCPEFSAVRFAQPDDIPEINEILLSDFDPLADQLPDEKELAYAVKSSSILVVPSLNNLKGFVYFTFSGLSATIKYWAVHLKFRNIGVGRELLCAYLLHTNGSKKNILWVKEKNENALKRYFHYGYRADGIVDQLLVKNFEYDM